MPAFEAPEDTVDVKQPPVPFADAKVSLNTLVATFVDVECTADNAGASSTYVDVPPSMDDSYLDHFELPYFLMTDKDPMLECVSTYALDWLNGGSRSSSAVQRSLLLPHSRMARVTKHFDADAEDRSFPSSSHSFDEELTCLRKHCLCVSRNSPSFTETSTSTLSAPKPEGNVELTHVLSLALLTSAEPTTAPSPPALAYGVDTQGSALALAVEPPAFPLL